VSQRVFAAVDALAGQYARARPRTSIEAHRADALADLVLSNADVETTVELVIPVLPTDPRHDLPSDPRHDLPTDPRDDLPTDPRQTRTLPDALDTLGAGGALVEPDGRPAHATRWFVPGSVDVPRHGELLPEAVSELLSRPATLVRLARLDPDGSLRQDPTRYRPGASTVRSVRARDGVCRFPGCGTPARRTDLDHVVPWPRGRTDPSNLICLCRTHHLFKHHGGWTVQLMPDGRATWTAPDGRTWTNEPGSHQLARHAGMRPLIDPRLHHELQRGWFPGLPIGMGIVELAAAERCLPEDPPESDHTPTPPHDWLELDTARLVEDHLSVLERWVEHLLAA
jgi:hypothetical protein